MKLDNNDACLLPSCCTTLSHLDRCIVNPILDWFEDTCHCPTGVCCSAMGWEPLVGILETYLDVLHIGIRAGNTLACCNYCVFHLTVVKIVP